MAPHQIRAHLHVNHRFLAASEFLFNFYWTQCYLRKLPWAKLTDHLTLTKKDMCPVSWKIGALGTNLHDYFVTSLYKLEWVHILIGVEFFLKAHTLYIYIYYMNDHAPNKIHISPKWSKTQCWQCWMVMKFSSFKPTQHSPTSWTYVWATEVDRPCSNDLSIRTFCLSIISCKLDWKLFHTLSVF